MTSVCMTIEPRMSAIIYVTSLRKGWRWKFSFIYGARIEWFGVWHWFITCLTIWQMTETNIWACNTLISMYEWAYEKWITLMPFYEQVKMHLKNGHRLYKSQEVTWIGSSWFSSTCYGCCCCCCCRCYCCCCGSCCKYCLLSEWMKDISE